MGRERSTESDQTVKRRVDVADLFGGDESPTAPAVPSHVPLDVIPALALPRTELPWDDLSALATQLLLRVDGVTPAMDIVTGTVGTPSEGARELASLARQGLVRLGCTEPPPASDEPDTVREEALEIDLSAL